MTRHTLPGLRPTPLGSYLAGLGLIRLLGEQADPNLTATWTPDGLVVDTTVDDIATWLVDQYVPTPVLSPWKRGTGLGPKDKKSKRALDDLIATTEPRLAGLRAAIILGREISTRYPPMDGVNLRAVREMRNRCADETVAWIDATVILANDRAFYPALLGTGGGDGNLDFSTNFHQRLLDVLTASATGRARSRQHAVDLLTGNQVAPVSLAAVGQFDAASAGGRNSSPFGDFDSLVNPWAYVLLIEGVLLFASSVARRHQQAASRAAVPFAVSDSPDGSTSGAAGEESRGEVWAPVWDEPFTLAEIRQLFAEARASWRGKSAQRAVEFYAATRTLGVARGVSGFIRYGLHRRNGLAFVAVPIEHVTVRNSPEVRLAAQLEDWVSWVGRGEASTAVGRTVRRFDAAHLKFARNGGVLPLARLLAAVTDLELAVGRSGRARTSVTVRTPPPANDFLAFLVERGEDRCPELRVAVGIASCATRPGSDPVRQPARSMRQILLPIDPGRRWRDTPVVAGFGLRPLRKVLADVLAWRSRTAADEQHNGSAFRGAPTFRNGIGVPDADLHAFATSGQLDDDLLDLWLRACLALRWDGVSHEWTGSGPPAMPVPTLGLLHPFASGLGLGQDRDREAPRLALGPDWAVRLAAGQLTAVHADAVRRLRQAGWDAVRPTTRPSGDGTAIAAALVPRCRQPQRVLRCYLATPIRTEESRDNQETTESNQAPQLVEEMS